MELYDVGERKAYVELFKGFAKEKLPVEVRNMGYRQMSLFDDVRFRENVML